MDALKHSHSQQTKALATRLRKEKYDAKGVMMRVYLTPDLLSKGADLRDKNLCPLTSWCLIGTETRVRMT